MEVVKDMFPSLGLTNFRGFSGPLDSIGGFGPGSNSDCSSSKVRTLECESLKKKKFKMADFSKSPILEVFLRKFHRLVLGLVGLIDTKDIDVAQLIWP